jgi:hypothetical protein
MAFAQTLDAIPVVPGKGRPRERPDNVHADKGYDCRRCWADLRGQGIIVRIARKGIESKEWLGRHRWVVERTHE